ncbi:MAG: GHKL domain-containing protein [Chloracidobacterium sp.]|nr:GHKL domain-containing protein [Chloracidobacterium sp.]MCC7307060.1 GHKL domain-containing protein [Acidobacteriota bacterium]
MDTQTFNIISPRNRLYVWIVIAVVIILITVLHFLTPTDQIVWHEIYQRIYYVPIIAAALIFGLRGGLAASLFTTIIYSPHVYLHWQHGHFDYSINQYAEIVIFNLVGGIMGALGDRLRKSRERAERNAEEKRIAYEELQTTFQQLLQAEKLASLGELSAGIVHEVRNPLASIKGAIEILEDELTNDSPRREFVGLAKGEIDRLDQLVGEFLRFARPVAPSKTPTDLNEIVDSITGLIANQAASQSIAVIRDLQKNLPLILVDAEQIKQVVLNLAINALQAMNQSNGADQTLTFRTFQHDNNFIVEVTDSGSGVDPKHLSKIFDPFFTTKEKGIGLGLSIAHKIATQHGGHLNAKRSADLTTFTLTIPIGPTVGLIN